MKLLLRTALVGALFGLPLAAQTPRSGGGPHVPDPEVVNSCGTCHGEARAAFERDVHAGAGLDCTTCHGGRGGALDAAEAHGGDLRPLSDPRAKIESCGGCHSDQERMRVAGLRTDQLSLYWSSGHGRKLAESDDPNVATCVSCHGAHGVLRHTDPRSGVHPFRQPETCGGCHADAELMQPYGLTADVVDGYLSSVHGDALVERGHLAAPACTDCHGAHGAQPPGVQEIELVCGSCHSVVQEFYEQSAHFTGSITNGAVQCETCHENHAVMKPTAALFVGGEERHCGSCHEDDAGAGVARELHEQVEGFAGQIAETEAVIADAASQGLYMEFRHGYVEEAKALLVRARAMTHAGSPELLVDVLSRGDAMLDRTMEDMSLARRGSRDVRIFTALFFAVAIAFSIVLLMYARMIRGNWKEASRRRATADGQES
jgi:hypothetical protein